MKAKSILSGILAVLLIAGVTAISGCTSSDTQTSTTSKAETVSQTSTTSKAETVSQTSTTSKTETVSQTESDTTSQTALFTTPMERLSLEAEDSPEWVTKLDAAKDAKQLFVVAGYERSTAWISMHEKDENGKWKMIMTTPGFIGKEGLGKTKEGDAKTPVGTFHFTQAFGIADDPGCAMEYTKVSEDTYWSGDSNYQYNQMVSINDYPDLKKDDSERIMDYPYEYQYCLNISYNEEGKAGKGSAIFLHCFGNRKPRTGGCVAIPEEQMYYVMQHVLPDCVVVIDSMENFGAEF